MKFWSNKTCAQKVGILGIFGLGTLLVVVGVVEIPQYWKAECRLTTQNADEKAKAVGRVMGLSFTSTRAKPTLIDRVKSLFRHDGTEGIRFVGGQSELKKFEGKEDIWVTSYEVNCMYPPISILGPEQTIGKPPKHLPAYCHIPPEDSPSPTPSDPGCSSPPCAQATPSPIPAELDPKKLEGYLAISGGNKSYLQSVGALRLGTDPNLTEFWATGFVIADRLFATSCHAMEPLFEKGEYGLPKPDANGHYTFDKQNKLWVDFGTGQLNPDQNAHKLVPAEFVDCSYQEGLDIALICLDAADVPPPITLFYAEDFANKVDGLPAALITYGDLSHPEDEITNEMYESFVNQDANPGQYWSYRKFVMWEGIIGAAQCKNVDYLLNTASTTVGSSGSPVLAVFRPHDPPLPKPLSDPLDKPLVIGVHKCCSAYFGEENGYQEMPTIPCAKLHRSPFNQDVSSKSILEEPRFCKALSNGVQIEGYDGQKYELECSENAVKVKKK